MRSEIKYLVPESERARLHARLAAFAVPDPHAGGEGRPSYTVRSIYFDTADLRDYHQKEAGLLQRRKLRIRGYDAPCDGAPVFLEVKRKHEQAVWKSRAALPPETAWPLVRGRLSPDAVPAAEREAARHFLFRLRREARRPTLLVTYDREPLVGRFDPSLRLTFDRRLRCEPYPQLEAGLGALYAEARLRPVLRGHFILEVKFDRLYPSWLRPILGAMGLARQALSKYVIGLSHAARHTRWRFGTGAARALAPGVPNPDA